MTKPEFDYKEYQKQKAEKEKNNEEIKEEERLLLEITKERLKEDEDIKPHPYLDTKGVITTGVGANIDNKQAFMKVNWKVDERPATKAEKEAAYKAMKASKNNKEYGQKIGSQYYENKTNLKIDKQEAERMLDEHLKNDSKAIKKEIPDFDKLPFELKEVLMDIKYNTGGVRDLPAKIKNINDIPEENRKKYWPKLHQAIRDKDIEGIAKEIHRKDVSKERNEWARDKILSIKKW